MPSVSVSLAVSLLSSFPHSLSLCLSSVISCILLQLLDLECPTAVWLPSLSFRGFSSRSGPVCFHSASLCTSCLYCSRCPLAPLFLASLSLVFLWTFLLRVSTGVLVPAHALFVSPHRRPLLHPFFFSLLSLFRCRFFCSPRARLLLFTSLALPTRCPCRLGVFVVVWSRFFSFFALCTLLFFSSFIVSSFSLFSIRFLLSFSSILSTLASPQFYLS